MEPPASRDDTQRDERSDLLDRIQRRRADLEYMERLRRLVHDEASTLALLSDE